MNEGDGSSGRRRKASRGEAPVADVTAQMKLNLKLPILRSIMAPDTKAESTKVLGGGKNSDAANLEEHLQLQLVSGEDAIAFFARHGNNTPVKFVYCNRPDSRDEFRPYDMVIVDRKQIRPEYFTISAAGVVHVQPNEPSEFISLADWMHQSTLFNVLRSIRFFKHYLIAKMFRLWRSNVRYRLYCKQRKQLSKNLFLARPSFCPSIIEVNKLMYEIERVQIAKVAGTQTGQQALEPEQFEQQQVAQRNQAQKNFERLMEKLENCVEKVCKGVKDRARAYDHSIANDDLSNSRFAEHLLGGNGRTRSMVSVKKERAERVRKLKHAAFEAELLGDFIRLVDYMEVEHLVEVVLCTTGDFMRNLQTRKSPLFVTKVHFKGEALQFSPDVAEIHKLRTSMLEGLLTTVDTVERICSNPKFHPYIAQQLEGPKVSHICHADDSFNLMKGHCESRVDDNFRLVREEMVFLDDFRPIYEFGKDWNFEAYSQQTQTVESIQTDMDKQSRDITSIEKGIRNIYDVGIFQAETKGLKAALLPNTQRALEDMKNLLLNMFHDQCASLHVHFQEKIELLDEDPTTLPLYAKHTELVTKIRVEGTLLKEESRKIQLMHTLLLEHKMKIPTHDAVAFEDLLASGKDFEKQLKTTTSLMGEKMADMRTKVYKFIVRLTNDLATLKASLVEGIYIDETQQPKAVVEALEKAKAELADIAKQAALIQDYQRLFDIDPHNFSTLPEVEAVYTVKNTFWTTYLDWENKLKTWEKQHLFVFDEKKKSKSDPLDAEDMNKQVQEFFMQAHKMNKAANNSAVTSKFKREVEEEKSHMPVLLDLANKAYTEEHWGEVRQKLLRQGSSKNSMLYGLLKRCNYWEHEPFITEVTERAVGEYGLRNSLEKIKQTWNSQEIITADYTRAPGNFILGDVEELMLLLEDNQVLLQTMLGSRYIMKMQADVEEWNTILSNLSDIIDEWLTCQRNWMYLEPIFTAADIQRQLPVEAKLFMEVDRFFKSLMKQVHSNPSVMFAINVPNIFNNFLKANKDLDTIQKQLEEYLETKRSGFPRFYFLSNDELLQILSQSRDPQAVQPHLGKCFDEIKRIEFTNEPNSVEVTHMVSGKGEKVALQNSVFTTGNVEDWLTELERMMRVTVKAVINKTLKDYPEGVDRNEWFNTHFAQPCCYVDQIMWTSGCTKGLEQIQSGENKNGLKDFLEFSKGQIGSMVDMVRGDLTKMMRTMMSCVIILDVHGRDVVDTMVQNGCSSLSDYEWAKQLRYYWESHWVPEGDQTEPPAMPEDEKAAYPLVPEWEDVYVKQTNASFKYGNEYLGCPERLVITPLTDKCILTLTGALHLHYGGAPAGPAGTGKTETVKDLAKALAIQIVVFNCSDGLNAAMMGRFFSGLAQAGAWACFDEFNRIDIEVLSVIAQQILTVQQAINNDKSPFEFEGRSIPLNKNFGVFITMNPGYAGRTELPDNLKALFRPVAMMVPDYRLIAQIILFSEGFQTASVLSTKMAQLYKLSSEQLSKQDHYDFGMRAVKSVLVMAGTLKRTSGDLPEDAVLIRAMRDSNVPKFLEHDLPLFSGIISDLFPGVEVPFVDYGSLQMQIEAELDKRNMQKTPGFITKCIQFHETTIVRHGVMLVGQTTTGKSSASDILAAALTEMKANGIDAPKVEKIEQFRLNPKAVSMGELYGYINQVSQEWTEGLVALLVREACQDTSPTRKWIMFDGPVDALWIENMNTVLDDNKVLCLANGERIKLAGTISMIFECEDLSVASPATVSRCGMVFLELVHVGWRAHVDTWRLNVGLELMAEHCDFVINRLKPIFEKLLNFVQEECVQKIEAIENNMVGSCLNLLHALVLKHTGFADQAEDERLVLLRKYLFMSCVWSFGANIHDINLGAFNEKARVILGELVPDLPESGSVYDYNVAIDGTFVTWKSQVKDFEYDPKQAYFSILVPTEDTTRYSFLLDTLINANRNVLIIGDTGVGKTVVIQDLLSSQSQGDDAKLVQVAVTFSAQTTSQNLQDNFETKLDKKRKNLLGAPFGKKICFFVDDLNMPMREEYGAQPPVELLRQAVGSGGFYDRKKLFFKRLQDIVFLAACGAPGGGRNEMTARVVRHFHQIWQPQLAEASMIRIFTAILGGFLGVTAGHFGTDTMDLASKFVKASVEIYDCICKTMLPTPSKSHYTFNLRDLSKVIQGVCQIKTKNLADVEQLCRLWTHETSRVFRDRLVSEEDRTVFDTMVSDKLQSTFNYEYKPSDDLLFGDYMTQDDKFYQEITDQPLVLEKLTEYLYDYNMANANQMMLVFFRDAIAHLSRVSRVLRQPRGNALLVGVGGSGRQSLTRLASSMAGMNCSSIEITRGYSVADWHEALKGMLMAAGANNQPTVFLFTDTQVVHESFLEDINNILNAGEVPNLFEPDELDTIVGKVRPLVKAAGKVETRDNILSHYISLVRDNLHVVLAFSPVGDAFRARCRQYPSLVNCCTIDWYMAWPEDALFSVAERFLGEEGGPQLGELQEKLCHICVKIHMSVSDISGRYLSELRRHNYVTPTSYLELIKLYSLMLAEQKEIVKTKTNRYKVGLEKLRETNALVEDLRKALVKLQPELKKSSEETAALLIDLEKDQAEAKETAAVCQKDADECAQTTLEVSKIKADCQRGLDEALPAFESAVKALDTLDKESITMVKNFKNPSKLVKDVMEAVCILFGEKPTWPDAMKLLANTKFLDNCKAFDKDNISKGTVKKLQKYVTDPDFTPEKMKSVSTAAVSLCMWVRAMDVYARVAKEVGPKRKALEEAEKQLMDAQQVLAGKQMSLRVVEARVAQLQAKFKAKCQERDDISDNMEKTKARLARAQVLVDGLGSEEARWSATAKSLEADFVNLVGNMALAAGCISYMGPFTAGFRAELQAGWNAYTKELGVPVDDEFDFIRVLADPIEVRQWGLMGLPADTHSTQNGILTNRGRRWPLMVDPQNQANRWIKNFCKKDNLRVIKLTESDYLRVLENAIQFGQPVLLENVEDKLDAAIEPVLLKQVFKRGGQWLLKLGDKDVPYSQDFKFYITTKLPNPHYLPEVFVKVTIINFTVTPKGLEDQLLVAVCGLERPDLEEKNDQLIVQIADDKAEKAQLEATILRMLSEATGNILDDEDLINALASSKKTSAAVSQRMIEAEQVVATITEVREEYRVVATRASILYFVIADLAKVDPMYQYSLLYFTNLYKQRISTSEKSDDLQKRLQILLDDLSLAVYNNICQGLFEVHKLMFSFLIASNIEKGSGVITPEEWNYCVRGTMSKEEPGENPCKDWLSDETWTSAARTLPVLAGISADLTDSAKAKLWKEYVESFTNDKPAGGDIPAEWDAKLTLFQKLLVAQLFRKDKLVACIKTYVTKALSPAYVRSPPFDLNNVYSQSTARTPIVFVLSPGADPMAYLLKLAGEKGKLESDKFRYISLGQGQGPVAEELMNTARQEGGWVCLQNCHLSISWLPKLEQILEAGLAEDVHDEYRLWLTSMPTEKFPVPILQNSIKVTNEPPKGLRSNLTRSFLDIEEEEYEACIQPRPFKKLIFGLAFFHAVLLERRKFGPIGWNIPYEWMNSDLEVSKKQLKMYLDEQPDVPWTTLREIIGEVNYAGRVTDDKDQRGVSSLLARYFDPGVLSDDYRFTDGGNDFYAPAEGKLADVRAFVENLPDETPDAFGLHDNADITLNLKETKEMIDTLLLMQPRAGGGGGAQSPEEIATSLAIEFEKRLPEILDKRKAHESTFKDISSTNTLGVFLGQEIDRFNKLLRVMKGSLRDLQKSMKGLIVMSTELEQMFNSFCFNQVPNSWAHYPSLKPLGSWFDDFVRRVEFVREWMEKGQPDVFWLPGFFFPQGFMTGVLQKYARRTKIPIDTLIIQCQVQKFQQDSPEVKTPDKGVLIYGLHLQGAGWDVEKVELVESDPGVLFLELPCIWLIPVAVDDPPLKSVYPCPVYKTSTRAGTLSTTGHSTNFVLFLELPSKKSADHWVRRGTALLTMLDD